MIFKVKEAEDFFHENGYVVVDLLEEDTVNFLKNHFTRSENRSGLDSNFYTSIWSKNKEFRVEIDTVLKKELKPSLDRVFKHYKAAFANYMVKKPGESSALQPHQDWNFVKEPEFYSVTVWIPLQDVDEKNGTLEVLPKSHLLSNYIRARFLNSPFNHQLEEIKNGLMLSIPLKKGQAIVVNSRTIHSSPDNQSNLTRVAASIVLFPENAELIHYVLDKDKENEIFELDITERFFTDYNCFEKPKEESLSNRITYNNKPEDVLKLMKSYEK